MYCIWIFSNKLDLNQETLFYYYITQMHFDNIDIIVILPDHCLVKFLVHFITYVNILCVCICISSKTHILNSNGRLRTLPTNIRLRSKWLIATNALAYCASELIPAVKCNMILISILQVICFAQKDDKELTIDNLKRTLLIKWQVG